MTAPRSTPRPVAVPGASPAAPPPVRLDSARLFAGAREVEIDHGGAVYKLKLTALGKLILTK